MAFRAFLPHLVNVRAIEIPRSLDAPKRAQFIERIQKAVEKQRKLSEQCDAILRLADEAVEVRGDRILIWHEPAYAADAHSFFDAKERPDIQTLWWLAQASIQALAAAAKAGIVHGGIQPGVLFLDRLGRLKLGDWGLVIAIEQSIPREDRARLALDHKAAAVDPNSSARAAAWALLDEDQSRPFGWVGPYSAPKTMEGSTRAFSFDLFATGVTLYHLACGAHPIQVDFSEPETTFYVTFDADPLRDHRRDWGKVFDRRDADGALKEDRPVLEWSDLVVELLAFNRGTGTERLDGAMPRLRANCPAAWTEAAADLESAAGLLQDRTPQWEQALSIVGRWLEEEQLPAEWRAALAAFAKAAETEKAEHDRLRGWRDKLDAIRKVVGRGELADLNKAMSLARDVASEPACPEEIRNSADALWRELQQQRRQGLEQGRSRSAARLERARQAFQREQFEAALAALSEIERDEWSPDELRHEAAALSEKVSAAQDAIERVSPIYTDIEGAISDGDTTRARELLSTLLETEDWPESLRLRREEFDGQVDAAAALGEESRRVFEQIDAALERLDVNEAERILGDSYFDPTDSRAAGQISVFQREFDRMRVVLDAIASAKSSMERGEFDQGMNAIQAVQTTTGVRGAALLAAQEIYDRCAEAKSAALAQRRGQAKALLDDGAQRLWDEGRWHEMGEKLAELSTGFAGMLSPDDQRRLDELSGRYRRANALSEALDESEKLIAAHRDDAARARLKSLKTDNAPAELATRREALLKKVTERVTSRWTLIRETLDQVRLALIAGDQSVAEQLIRGVNDSLTANDEGSSLALPKEVARVHKSIVADVDAARKLRAALATARAALDRGDPLSTLAGLKGLIAPAEWAWAADEPQALREAATALGAEQLDAAVTALRTALDTADASAAAAPMERAKALLTFDPSREKALREAEQRLHQLAESERELTEVERLQSAKKWREVASRTKVLLGGKLPAPLRGRVEALQRNAEQQIESERKQLEEQLAGLEAKVQAAAKPPRGIDKQVIQLAGNARLTAQQRVRIEALRVKLAEVRRASAKPPLLWVGSGVAFLAIAATATWLMVQRPSAEGEQREQGGDARQQDESKDAGGGEPEQSASEKSANPAGGQGQQSSDDGAAAVHGSGEGGEKRGGAEDAEAGSSGDAQQQADEDDAAQHADAEGPNGGAQQEDVDGQSRGAQQAEADGDQSGAKNPPPVPEPEPEPEPTPEPTPDPPPEPPAALMALRGPLSDDQFWAAIEFLAPQWAQTHPQLREALPQRARGTLRSTLDETAATLVWSEGDAKFSLSASIIERNWTVGPENGAALEAHRSAVGKSLVEGVGQVIRAIDEAVADGQLVAAHRERNVLVSQLPALEAWGVSPELIQSTPSLPPLWQDAKDVRATLPAPENDPLGYPLQIVVAERTLERVYLKITDAVWSSLEQANATDGSAVGPLAATLQQGKDRTPPWALFYLEGPEPKVSNMPAEAVTASVDEWIVAFLSKPATPLEFGAWDWAVDRDGSAWVLGGCEAHRDLLPLGADRLAWLSHPLVSQPRAADFGDDLAGWRAVWRPPGWPTLAEQLGAAAGSTTPQ